MKKYIMSLDQGTTSSRCILFDKNGDIVSSTYPQYGSVVENGQACTMDVLFKGVPYGIRIASANITPMENNQTTNDRIEVYFESPFVAVNPNPGN